MPAGNELGRIQYSLKTIQGGGVEYSLAQVL